MVFVYAVLVAARQQSSLSMHGCTETDCLGSLRTVVKAAQIFNLRVDLL